MNDTHGLTGLIKYSCFSQQLKIRQIYPNFRPRPFPSTGARKGENW